MIHQILMQETTHPAFEPKYANAKARSVWNRAVRSFESTYPLDFTVTGAKGVFRVAMDAAHARQDSDSGSLCYVGAHLQIKTKKGVQRKSIARPHLLEWASRSGLDVDPVVQAWSFGQNPMGNLVSPGSVARVKGAMSMNGTPCDLFELSSKTLRINMVLRHNDGLPLRIWSEIRDARGSVLSSSERRFSYISIGKKLPAARFKL